MEVRAQQTHSRDGVELVFRHKDRFAAALFRPTDSKADVVHTLRTLAADIERDELMGDMPAHLQTPEKAIESLMIDGCVYDAESLGATSLRVWGSEAAQVLPRIVERDKVVSVGIPGINLAIQFVRIVATGAIAERRFTDIEYIHRGIM